jgi:hypothetical protein
MSWEKVVVARLSMQSFNYFFVDGLTNLFSIIKTTENVRDLPSDFQAVLEWARISQVAYTSCPCLMLMAPHYQDGIDSLSSLCGC